MATHEAAESTAPVGPSSLPTGTVTLLFTDVEGSTRLWEREPEAMAGALRRHDELVEQAVVDNAGMLVRPRGEGDSRFAVFTQASNAAAAALAIQRALEREPWALHEPMRVRIAIHTGEADLRDGDYYGLEVNRCARLRSLAHGGQILLSGASAALVQNHLAPGCRVRSLGLCYLRYIAEPEHVYQLEDPDVISTCRSYSLAGARATNLTSALTPLIGREQDVDELCRRLATTRLVTLVGPGGVGKTRLALDVAWSLVGEYHDGVWFIDLAALRDERLVAHTFGAALGLREQSTQSGQVALEAYLRERHVLLVVDNCEHVLDACGEVIAGVLRTCPGVHVLTTSRERLAIPGEVTWHVAPLRVPEPGMEPSVADLLAYPAVQLFNDRVSATTPEFQLAHHSAAVAQVCVRLEGMPLALELAAARVRALSVEQIAQRLDDRFRLLTASRSTAPTRQQTLRATLDWSYDLLSARERLLFGRLAVFAGGWTLDAAELVCAGGGIRSDDVLDLLERLIDKSLVLAESGSAGSMRYGLLQTNRDYALERLVERGELKSTERRHTDFFLALIEEALPYLRAQGEAQGRWLERLDRERDNLRAALHHAIERQQAETAARYVLALWRYWLNRGYLAEGQRWLALVLELIGPAPTPARLEMTNAAGNIALVAGDYDHAEAYFAERLAHGRDSADQHLIAASLNSLGNVALERDDLALARTQYRACLALWRAAGNGLGVATALHNLGLVAHRSGNYRRAVVLFEACLELDRDLDIGKGDTAIPLASLGGSLLGCGDYAQAARLLRQSLATFLEVGNRPRTPLILEHLAGVALAQGDATRAARLLGFADALREEVGHPHSANDRYDVDRYLSAANAALGVEAMEHARAEGRAMPVDVAYAYALA